MADSDSDGNDAEGVDDSIPDPAQIEEVQPYDISLTASHSYLGPGLVSVGGRRLLEAGWRGRLPVLLHHGVVFPGETVPMLLPHGPDADVLVDAIKNEKLFGLLCPDEVGGTVSGFGVICEVEMAGIDDEHDGSASVTFKARATHRFRMVGVPRRTVPLDRYANRMVLVEVRVLAEMASRDSLRPARLAALDPLREPAHLDPQQQLLRRMDAALTPWPLFVYHIFDYDRLRSEILDYFKDIMSVDLPDDPVSLSFWVASNLALRKAERLALFLVDNALLRLHMESQHIKKQTALCCTSCQTEIARREHIFAMSSEGVHSNYTNLGGYMHDILTVRQTSNVQLSGAPSAEYSWFPGYTWTVLLCNTCMAHIGWRFQAEKRSLRPQRFFGLCRNYVQPRPPDP
ncbi:protein cereblon-like [Trichoplusia ni]|uniref:Protein cereblon n=1 Tax=Trichoplusia ni TaxID=7111 RepID=A0A7E5WIH5_TRINI|nr:protein cereblon-like [Trichoplusia ni]